MNRRHFIKDALKLAAILNLFSKSAFGSDKLSKRLFSGANDQNANYLWSYDLLSEKALRIKISQRCHSVIIHPKDRNRLLAIGRRNFKTSSEINFQEAREEKIIPAMKDFSFYGHATFSANGDYLFSSETSMKSGQGSISIRDGSSYRLIDHIESGGSHPHDLHLADESTLVVANGVPHPGLSLIDLKTKKAIDRIEIPNPNLSFEHFSVANRHSFIVPLVDKNETDSALILLRKNGKSDFPLYRESIRKRMKGYCLSVCISRDKRTAVVTHTYGNIVTFWDLETETMLGTIDINKPTGAENDPTRDLFIVSSEGGALHFINNKTFEVVRTIQSLAGSGTLDSHLTVG